MYKLKNTYIDRMIQEKLSSCEIDFILYIARFQSEDGTVQSVYYKDICQTLGISIQKYYDMIASLTEKNLINWRKENRADIVVGIVGNDFTSKEFTQGYLNVSSKDFLSDKFKKLKAGSKLLYLYLQRFVNGKHMLVNNFYEEFCRRFQVKAKSLQIYLHELKETFLLFISKKRNRAYRYEMTMKNSTVLDLKSFQIPREKDGFFSNVGDKIRRKFKRYLPENNPDLVVKDIVKLIDTERIQKLTDYLSYVMTAIEDSLDQQREEGKKKPRLNAALINKRLTKMLEMSFV